MLRGRVSDPVYDRERLLFGSLPSRVVTRTVRVVSSGKSIGRVVAVIPLNSELVDQIATVAHVEAPNRLLMLVGPAAAVSFC